MTEVRLCQCGKPAGHQSVCALGPDDGDHEIERIDRRYEAVIAERAEARFHRHKREFDADRRARRADLSALELHRLAVERAVTISTVSGSNPEPSRGQGEHAGPPRQQQLSDDPRWRESEHVIRSRLLRMHELLDEAEGLGPVADKTMLAAEKDQRIVREGEGLSAGAVVALLGTDIAGSAETVRRVRRQAGRSAKDGRRLDRESTPAAGLVRRVVIDEERGR